MNFPDNQSIPEEYKIGIPFKQTSYLINGELRVWQGDFEKVFSPVYYKKHDDYENMIGEYPLMGEKESLEALDAAVKAFDNSYNFV